jgi:hypothetical protein
MAARQIHGFDYQEKIIKEWNLLPDNNYTGKNDAYSIEKGGAQIPVQIKCIKHGSAIDLGCYNRNKYKEKGFIMFIGFWSGKKNNIIEEYMLDVNAHWWRDIFKAPAMYDFFMFNFLKRISNDKEDDLIWKLETKRFLYVWERYWDVIGPKLSKVWEDEYTKRLVVPRFKRDHKKQKRIQCSIPNKMFYNHFLRWA